MIYSEHVPCVYDSCDLCLTHCKPMDCSPPGSLVHEISQATILDWAAFPTPRDLPDPGIQPMSPPLAGGFFILEHLGNP